MVTGCSIMQSLAAWWPSLRLWRSCLEILLTKIAGIASSEECATCSMWERGKLLYPFHLCGKHGLAEGMSLDMLYVLMYCLILYDFVTVWLYDLCSCILGYGGQVVSHLSFPCVFFSCWTCTHICIHTYIHIYICIWLCDGLLLIPMLDLMLMLWGSLFLVFVFFLLWCCCCCCHCCCWCCCRS